VHVAIIALTTFLFNPAGTATDSLSGDARGTWSLFYPGGKQPQYLGIVSDADGNIWASDFWDAQIVRRTRHGFRTFSTEPYGLGPMAVGSDGAFYAIAYGGPYVVRRALDGTMTEFKVSESINVYSLGISRGDDGNIWFYEPQHIGVITPAGQLTEYSVGSLTPTQGTGIAEGPGGLVWFQGGPGGAGKYFVTLDPSTRKLATIPTPANCYNPTPLTEGADGNIWVICDVGEASLWRITPQGAETSFNLPPYFASVGLSQSIVSGPDGALWFVGQNIVHGRVAGGAVGQFDIHKQHSIVYRSPRGYEWEQSLAFDRLGHVWFGTETGQVQELVP
jgi:streptogramin lyase